MSKENLSKSYGVKLDFSVYSEVRPFAQVEAALARAQIVEGHQPKRPTMRTALSRARAYLSTAASRVVDMPGDHHGQVDAAGNEVKYSLKITDINGLKHAWRVNVTCNNKHAENMGHVLNVTYDPTTGYACTPGDAAVYAEFGAEVEAIVRAQYDKFLNNYADMDVRYVVDKELDAMHALRILNNTNAYVPNNPADIERADRVYQFLLDCNQRVSWLGLDADTRTRDSLLRELKGAIFEEMDAFEANLEERLNNPPTEKVRGDKARERLYSNASENLDAIMAKAEYHRTILGALAEGVQEREAALRERVKEFLSRDFGSPVAKGPSRAELLAEIEKLKAENASLAGQEATPAPADASDPFANVG